MTTEPLVRAGRVDPRIAAELPGIGLAWCEFTVAHDVLRRSPPELRERLRTLSDRARGAQALALRSRPIPHAYRVLFRHLGLEPDVRRIPVEELMLSRLVYGAYLSRGLLSDALAVATVETEVGVWALDADAVTGTPGLALLDGRVVVEAGELFVPVFSAPPEPTHSTRRLVVYAITAPGVPAIAVEEALWLAWDLVA